MLYKSKITDILYLRKYFILPCWLSCIEVNNDHDHNKQWQKSYPIIYQILVIFPQNHVMK